MTQPDLRQANCDIYRAIPKEYRLPMIVYALDPQLMNDDLYRNLRDFRDRGILPLDMPWLMGLFWIRIFYEETQGDNFIQVLLPVQNANDPRDGITRVWRVDGQIDRNFMIRECPVIRAEEQGQDSQIIKYLKFIAKGLEVDFTDGELNERIGELVSIVIMRLLAQNVNLDRCLFPQVECYRDHPRVFSHLIRALLTREGQGWLRKIANHPLFKQVTLPKWGVYKNGPVASIALRLQTRLAAVVFYQDGVESITREVHNGELIVALDDFLSNGFEAGTHIQTSDGLAVNLPDLDLIHLARVSRKRRFHPFVELTDEDHAVAEIQAAQLFAVMPNTANNAFRLGPIIVQATLLPLRNSLGHQLAHLDFSAIDRGQPVELRHPANLNGNVLLKVGAAPSLSLANSAELFEVHGDRDTWIIFGTQAQICLHDFHGIDAQVQWPGTVVPDPQGLQATLTCPLEDLGTKKHVTLQIPGRNYAISLSILFLPPELRHAMISETVAECGGISWQPEVEPDTIRLRVEHTGLCPGILRVGQQNLQFSFPSTKFHFWNFRGVAAEKTMDQPGTYDTIDEMNSLRSVLYVPDGDHELSWNGNVVQSLQGPGCYEVFFRELVQGENATRCTAERKLEMIGLQGTRRSILVCRAYPEVRRGDGAWDLVVPDGFDLQNHQVAFVAEGAIGVRVLMVKPCAELQWQVAEGVTIHRLDPINPHPDQGTFLLLWQGAQHLADLVMEPNRPPGVYGPFPLQHQNRFLSWDSFVAEVGDDIQAEVYLPGWLSAGWTDRHAILNPGTPANPLGQNHSPQIVAACLNEMILSGIIWFADSNWGGDGGSLSRRLHEVLAAIGPVGLLNTRLGALSQHCPLVGELVAVVQGRHPVLAWLDWPAFRLGADGQNLVPIGAAANHQYQINFEYGGGIGVLDMSRFRRSGFSWEYLPNQAHVTGAGNVVIPVSFGCAIDAISGLFDTILEDGAQFLGPRLSDVLSDLRGKLRAHFGEARSLLFETAALCRIRSWLPANPPPSRESEIVRNVLREAWQNNACRDALTRDLATIEWLLAWFREGSFVAQPVLQAQLADNEIQTIGVFLNDEVAAERIWFAEPEWGGGYEQSVPLLDRLAELSGVLGDYGGQQWEQAVAPCPLLGEFAMIARGDFGDRMWIPRNRIVMHDNQRPMPHVANIQFSYGHRTKRDNHEGFREPLRWQFTGQAPTLPLHFQQDYPVGGNVAAYPQQINELINQCFGGALQHCHNLIGNSGQQTDLAYFFQCLSSWFGRYPGPASGRPAIFRLAVLCRLRAWVTPGIADQFLNQRQLNVLVPVIQNIWANPEQCDLLINDLTAVEWSLAWLHQPQ